MSRISLMMVAVAVAAGVVGCAQCDTCDDFPAPCTGPNCGGNAAMLAPTMTEGGPPVMGSSTPASGMSGYDSAGPAPVAPPSTPSPSAPPAEPASPPPPMDPSAKPN